MVFHRAGRPWSFPPPDDKIENNTILTINNETGEVMNNWGAGLFLMPHGIEVDHENNIWVTDVGLQQVLKFNSDGKLLMTLGEANILGNDSLHFSLRVHSFLSLESLHGYIVLSLYVCLF